MKFTPSPFFLIPAFIALAFSILRTAHAAEGYRPSAAEPPPVRREFRGAWVATVWNLDWPSKAGLPVSRQQAELIAILDRAVELNLNAILLQVRPNADALYASKIEPWSAWLTGTMGKAPEPFYDPLEFAVIEAHRRGLELHAWFNPFRALANADHPAPRNHVSRRHPDWTIRYGSYLLLDPGRPEVRRYVTDVILDVVRRYDIDGVHLDDYFYPYPIKTGSGNVEIADSATWNRYRSGGGNLNRADWRRQNVNTFIENLYAEIKKTRRDVKVGISPFGIWRPRVPPTIEAAVDSYEHLFADSRLWLREGWLDYFSPQLYWSIKPAKQSFPVLFDWWAGENRRNRHFWPGIATERIGKGRDAGEIISQINLTRRREPGGQIHWSMKSLMQNKGGIARMLPANGYEAPALIPPSPWLSVRPPGPVSLTSEPAANGVTFVWKSERREVPRWWLVQQRYPAGWITRILPGVDTTLTIREQLPVVFAVTPVSSTGITGRPAVVERR